MDAGDGRRVITCAAWPPHDKTIINRMMLRFRPIAPKPVAGDSSSGEWKAENKNGLFNKGRVKRKYVRVKKNNEYYKRRKKKVSPDEERGRERADDDDDPNKKVSITLQLLPEKTDLTQDSSPPPPIAARESWCNFDRTVTKDRVQEKKEPPMLFNFNKQLIDETDRFCFSDPTAVTAQKMAVETWMTVESVTDTCMDTVASLGSTDVEKVKNLENDTCPGFISDSLNKVNWVNNAYRKMVTVSQKHERQSPEITAWLVIKEKFLPYLYYSAFTCWVRLQYTWQKEKCTQIVPCDVWRMDFGGYAWRLDIKAALSLGL